MRIGKFRENKIFFRDTTTGRRGIQQTQSVANAYYRLCFFQRVAIPARGTATNIGGTARYGRTCGGNLGGNALGSRFGTYCRTTWGHGLASVRGFMFYSPNSPGGGKGPRATAPNSYMRATQLNATTVYVSCNQYTAATLWVHALIWGATAVLY